MKLVETIGAHSAPSGHYIAVENIEEVWTVGPVVMVRMVSGKEHQVHVAAKTTEAKEWRERRFPQ